MTQTKQRFVVSDSNQKPCPDQLLAAGFKLKLFNLRLQNSVNDA